MQGDLASKQDYGLIPQFFLLHGRWLLEQDAEVLNEAVLSQGKASPPRSV